MAVGNLRRDARYQGFLEYTIYNIEVLVSALRGVKSLRMRSQ